jgi:hypothetical protein
MSKSIQEVVTATLKEMGLSVARATLLHTFALSQGRLVAEKFHYDGGYAVRNMGRGRVDCYDDGGGLLRSVVVEVADEQETGTAA